MTLPPGAQPALILIFYCESRNIDTGLGSEPPKREADGRGRRLAILGRGELHRDEHALDAFPKGITLVDGAALDANAGDSASRRDIPLKFHSACQIGIHEKAALIAVLH